MGPPALPGDDMRRVSRSGSFVDFQRSSGSFVRRRRVRFWTSDWMAGSMAGHDDMGCRRAVSGSFGKFAGFGYFPLVMAGPEPAIQGG